MRKIFVSMVCLLCCLLCLCGCGKNNNKKVEQILENENFMLSASIPKYHYALGEEISFSATLENISGRDLAIVSNGKIPCASFQMKDDNSTRHGETTARVEERIEQDGEITRSFVYTPEQPGIYILDVHASVGIMEGDYMPIRLQLSKIYIEVE